MVLVAFVMVDDADCQVADSQSTPDSLSTSDSLSTRDSLSYSRDVRPLLSKHCFACHGPDENTRQADMRLDVAEEADLDEVIARITSDDPDMMMPPPAYNKPVDKPAVKLLRTWISQGAQYEDHWAFVQPVQLKIAANSHPVDHFIDRQLTQQNRKRSPPTDPLTLIRRVHLDLIGLPPTAEVADAFVADPSPESYTAIVDSLLQSPRYGERWARRWLDLARYADTNGYEKDRDRNIWPYRDWVIRALNQDMPFDQFTIEQLAGDMLPNATADQLVATGFHRNTMLNEEGGIDPLEFRFHAMTDRVSTTGTTWLGLTVGCAQCHTHKYDPISHQDYYGMMAYLNNADEPKFYIPKAAAVETRKLDLAETDRLIAELDSHWPTPESMATTHAKAQADEDAKAKKEKREPKQLETPKAPRNLNTAFAHWIKAESENIAQWKTIVPDKATSNALHLSIESDGVIFASGDITKHDVYSLRIPEFQSPVHSLRLEVLPDERLPGLGPGMTFYEGRAGDFFFSELQIELADGSIIEIENGTETGWGNGFGKSKATAAEAFDGDIQTGWSISSEEIGRRNVAVFRLKQPIPAGSAIEMQMHFGRHYASSLGKFRWSATSDKTPVKASKLSAALARQLDSPDASQNHSLRTEFLLQAPELVDQQKRIHRRQTSRRGTETLVMQERPPSNKRQTFVHHRGEFTNPTTPAPPRLPAAIVAEDVVIPTNRLEFAKWLVSRKNPLTARVTANRHWAALFGTGIVSTVGDFGMQGEAPSHPELLDYLAVELMNHDWSIKHLHRLIVTSKTYQQSSDLPDKVGAQQADRLLGHFPRRRLEAEIIRDSSLAAAGLLSDKMYGKPVRPPQSESARGANYSQSKWMASEGPDRYRRSIYTYHKRTAPFAMFTTFDAGSGEACIARRDVSNTPLQALTLMNDPMFVEIAEAYGKRMDDADGDNAAKIKQGFRWLITREPSETELELLLEFQTKHTDWAALARVMLCIDEAITKN